MFQLRDYQANSISGPESVRDIGLAPTAQNCAMRVMAAIQKTARTQESLARESGTGVGEFETAWKALRNHDLVQPYPEGWIARRGAVMQVYDCFLGDKSNGRDPVQRVLLCSPTGAGKTVMALKVSADALAKEWRVVFVVDRQSLVTQTEQTFRSMGYPIGFLWAGGGKEYAPDIDAPVQIWSRQTIDDKGRDGPEADTRRGYIARFIGQPKTLVIIDEAHNNAWCRTVRAWLENPGLSWYLGLTATPYRLAVTEGMGDLFDGLASTIAYERLMETPEPGLIAAYRAKGFPIDHMGALVRPVYFALEPAKRVKTDGIGKVGWDYNQTELAKASNHPELIRAMFEAWREKASGRRTIAFCVDKQHTHDTAAYFASQGVSTAVITGTAKETYRIVDGQRIVLPRQTVVILLTSGEVTIVVSCEALTTGFDCPPAEVCLLMRATESLALFVQMIGRVLRPCADTGKGAPSRGFLRKNDVWCGALILDQTNTITKPGFGPVELIREFKLIKGKPKGGRKDKGLVNSKECPKCFAIVSLNTWECPGCGHQWDRPKAPELKGVRFQAREIGIEDSSEKSRRSWFRRTCRDAYWGNRHTRRWAKGNASPGAMGLAYKDKFGEWPPEEYWYLAPFGMDTESMRASWYRHLQACCNRRRVEQRQREPDHVWVSRYFRLVFRCEPPKSLTVKRD